MLKRMIFPLLLGLLGAGILLALGGWQVSRMAWKAGVLAHIASEIQRPPVALDPKKGGIARQNYLSVRVQGKLSGQEIHVLTSSRLFGPGFRVIARLETGGGPILADLGFLPQSNKGRVLLAQNVVITGNILWPDELDSFTPAPDLKANIWFARDLPKMAAYLGTQDILVVARKVTPAINGITPWPVGIKNIPNNHMQYAITWFSLALAWLGMTGYWLWRIRQGLDEPDQRKP